MQEETLYQNTGSHGEKMGATQKESYNMKSKQQITFVYPRVNFPPLGKKYLARP